MSETAGPAPAPEPPAAPAEPAASAAPDAPVTPAARVDAVTQAWVSDEIANSPVSRDTEGYNHLLASLGKLRDRILAALGHPRA